MAARAQGPLNIDGRGRTSTRPGKPAVVSCDLAGDFSGGGRLAGRLFRYGGVVVVQVRCVVDGRPRGS